MPPRRVPPGPVLFRAPNWIGDAVLSLPALAALAARLPSRAVTVATRSPALEVFRGHPEVAELLPVPPAGADGGFVRALSARRFGLAVVLAPSFRSAWQAWRAGIPERWGYGGDLRRGLLTFSPESRRGRPKVHQARDWLDLLRAAGIPVPEDPLPHVEPAEADDAAATALWDMVSDGGLRPVVALNPGATFGPTKRWPADSFAEVGLAAVDAGAALVVLGGPDEGEIARRVARTVRLRSGGSAPVHVFAGAEAVPLRAVASLAPRAALLVTNDTGPMHLWAAGGGTVLAVFGMSLPELHRPLGGRAVIFHRSDLPCAGCYRRTCSHALECLRGVEARDVARAMLGILEEHRGAGPIEQSFDRSLESASTERSVDVEAGGWPPSGGGGRGGP